LSEERKEFLKKLGAFDFGAAPEFVDGTEVENKELTDLGDGKQYFGEVKNSLTHGKGVLIWPNEGIYIGWWKFGLATGKGRFIS